MGNCSPFFNFISMYEFKDEEEKLTKEYILSRISQEDIFYKYLGISPNTVEFFSNPLRADSHPDCKFYRDSRNVLKFHDFAYKWNVDCFNVVCRIHNCNYGEALHIIAKDFNLKDSSVNYTPNIIPFETKESIGRDIKVKRKEFTKEELLFWEENGWTKEMLDFYQISSLLYVWLDNNKIYTYHKRDMGFVYYFGMSKHLLPQYKLYFPQRTRFRFLQNTGNILQGYKQLPEGGDLLVITKSMKDVGLLNAYGIPAVAPMSESNVISEEQFEDLSNRFFHIVTLFDRDRAGMTASKRYKDKFNTIPLLFDANGKLFRGPDDPKDLTDHFKEYGNNFMIDLIEDTKQYLL